jgi:peptidoglycan/LPS O-acetylase OafA/YrhL
LWLSSYVVAPLFFWIWVAWLRVRFRPLAWLGKISYSIYLFHLAVVTPLAWWIAQEVHTAWRGWPLAFYLIPTLLLTVVVAAAVYYAVELPAINCGKRIAGTRNDLGSQAAP